MILFLHNRYRVVGGEERAVQDLLWLVREHLREDAELLERDSAQLGAAQAAQGLLTGGTDPDAVAEAVRRTGARIVHAHNTNPSFGPRALQAAQDAGAKVVLHLHNYRLVCAVGTCFDAHGHDCTDCQGRNTLPGLRKNCRRTNRVEAATYAAALGLHAQRLIAHADAVVVPSNAALQRLHELRAPLGSTRVHVLPHVTRTFATQPAVNPAGPALITSRLAVEKGVDLAIDACRHAQVPLTIAGDGPERRNLEQRAQGSDTTFLGRVDDARLQELRAAAGVALAPTRAHETYGLAAVEAMAAGLPVVATRKGALADLDGIALVEPDDAQAFAAAITRVRGDAEAARRALASAQELASPQATARLLQEIYSSVT